MNRYVIGIFFALGIGYWGYSWWQNDLAAKEAQTRQQAQKQSIAEMVRRANAIADWPATLSGGNRLRTTPIMTVELQQLWLSDRPVLFIGNIEDVAINKDGTYQVTVKYARSGELPVFLENKIRVILMCHESFATQLIKTVKAPKHMKIWADTAVVATIERIQRSTETDSEGSTVTIFSGIGKCVDAMLSIFSSIDPPFPLRD